VFVVCGNPDCPHNAEVDVSRLPDEVTFGDLQPRMVCSVCDHRGADVGPLWLIGPRADAMKGLRQSDAPWGLVSQLLTFGGN
jgi:hypothetical protein